MSTATPSRGHASRQLRIVIAATVVAVALLALLIAQPSQATLSNHETDSQRAVYHLTPASGWLSDPQRPIYEDGTYTYYYLASDVDNGAGGWRRVTTTDNVVFDEGGMSLPLQTAFPVWTGSSVIDTNNTAGFGAGAVVALATQPTGGDRYVQEQYLWYSTDGGDTFTQYGDPVILNDARTDWFRDPKLLWDDANSRWIAVIGELQSASFYTSPDLKNWTYRSTFSYTSPNIGGFECPDIFQMKADDGTWHWVLGASMQGDYSGQPDTFAYWTGSWNDTTFTPDQSAPQWLDYGWDWYAAVTWPDATTPDTKRYAIAWMNNWQYAPHPVKTGQTDGYNGQMSIVRELTLEAQGAGVYSMLSQPASTLDDLISHEWQFPDTTVSGRTPLGYNGAAYEFSADVSWTTATNVGVGVGESIDGDHHTNIGVYQGTAYVDRSASDFTAHAFGSHTQSEVDLGSGTTSVHLRVLVDRSSVEVFIDDGKHVISNQVMFSPFDTAVTLFSDGGSATFSNITVKEFADITTLANPTAAFADFEGSDYGTWSATGTAFGSAPSAGALSGQQPVTGYMDTQLANSFNGGDSTTGTLTSSSFTIGSSYINFLIGGGSNPRPAELVNDFEGSTWGTGWTATGDFAAEGPSTSSLPNQIGSKVLDTYVGGGDSSEGVIRSPEFVISRDYIDFLIAGGNHPWLTSGTTAANLVVDNRVVRTATGSDSSTMEAVSWDVHDLIGQSAHFEVVDHATGSWGHLMVDQIVFSSEPGTTSVGSNTETSVNLLVGGEVVRTATGQDSEHLTWATWDVRSLIGETAHIEVVDNNTGAWGHILVDEISAGSRPAT